jgi:predicted  nucleic acid-binding Zn-ribbon protein
MTTTTHQLEALEHEAAFVRSEITRLEDQELESMERGEALDAQLVLANAAVDDLAATLDHERARASETIARDRAELAELESKRLALRTQIAQTDTGETSLAMYDRIAHSKGTAIAEALNQRCSACQMMLRPQRWNDLRDNSANSESAHTIMTCENCGHMLYYDPARDAPTRKTVQSESIAAQIVRSSI